MRAPAFFPVLAALLLVTPHPALCDVRVSGNLPANWDATAWEEVLDTLTDMNAAPDNSPLPVTTIDRLMGNIRTLLRSLTNNGQNATVGHDNQSIIQFLRDAMTFASAYRRHNHGVAAPARWCSASDSQHRHLLRDTIPDRFDLGHLISKKDLCLKGNNDLEKPQRENACVACIRTETGCPCACYDALYELEWYDDDAVVLAIVSRTYDTKQLIDVYDNLEANSCRH